MSVIPQWPRLYGQPPASGVLRQQADDFVVDEVLGFQPGGAGEHWLVHVEKRGENTAWVARLLARLAGVPQRQVSWAGLKDRHAVTRQWFGVQVPGKKVPNWAELNSDTITVLDAQRHGRKLRQGAMQGNHFRLRIRQLEGDLASLEQRCRHIAEAGVPNYYGEQRFGIDGGNLEKARRMFDGRREKDRNRRSLYLSAARSFLFNQVCAARLESGTTQTLLPGDALMLAGSRSFFIADDIDDALQQRLLSGDVQLTAPLHGRGESPAREQAAAFEQAVIARWPELCAGLEAAGLKQERRALLSKPRDFSWTITADTLELSFFLPSGHFATSVVRELVDYRDVAGNPGADRSGETQRDADLDQ